MRIFRRDQNGEPIGLLAGVSFLVVWVAWLLAGVLAIRTSFALGIVVGISSVFFWYPCYHTLASFLNKREGNIQDLKLNTLLGEGRMAADVANELVGASGVAQTTLRPSGYVVVEKKLYHALTKGEFIKKEMAIRVVGIHEGALLVEVLSD